MTLPTSPKKLSIKLPYPITKIAKRTALHDTSKHLLEVHCSAILPEMKSYFRAHFATYLTPANGNVPSQLLGNVYPKKLPMLIQKV